jgi:hypothetical protein
MFKNINIPQDDLEQQPRRRGRVPKKEPQKQKSYSSTAKKFTKEEMTKMLDDYIRVDNVDEIPRMSHVRYITLDQEGRQSFRKGGYVDYVTNNYLQLNTGKFKWYVQRYHYDRINDPGKTTPIFETIFWKKRDQVDDIVDYLEQQKSEIDFLKEQINLCRDILQILKDEHQINREAIDKLKGQVSKCRQMCDRIVQTIR